MLEKCSPMHREDIVSYRFIFKIIGFLIVSLPRCHRKLYGRLGSASGIDPRLSWTGRQKALELAQLYREWEPPLEEKLTKLSAQKQLEEERALQR